MNRISSHFQMRVLLNAFEHCSLPLFVNLCFCEARTWRSFSPHKETQVPGSVAAAIQGLFQELEDKHGKALVSHALGLARL